MTRAILTASLLVAGAMAASGACAGSHRYGPHQHGPHRTSLHRASLSRAAHALAGASLALDPASGNYRIAYYLPGDPDKTLHHAVYIPATKIEPVIESDFVYREDRREVQYAYRISNGRQARQNVVDFVLEPVSEISALLLPPTQPELLSTDRRAQLEGTAATALVTPANWEGTVTTAVGGGLRIAWRLMGSSNRKGIAPGRKQEGFGMPADDLPGLVLAKLTGDAPVLRFDSAWPDGNIGDRLAYLTTHDYVTRPVAVPAIAIPDPYDPALVLDRIRAHTHSWIPLKLLDPLFSARLDHSMRAAAQALRRGDLRGARFDLEDLRTLLAVQHPSLETEDSGGARLQRKAAQIDLLAARVLYFDLSYVLDRLNQTRDHMTLKEVLSG